MWSSWLDLSYNSLTSIPDSISALTGLKYVPTVPHVQVGCLYLPMCFCFQLTPMVHCRSVWSSNVDLSYNHLASLPDSISALTGLRSVLVICLLLLCTPPAATSQSVVLDGALAACLAPFSLAAVCRAAG